MESTNFFAGVSLLLLPEENCFCQSSGLLGSAGSMDL
ncbi:unnamed protein product, partial [Vitis vinifera]|uniref:Uncharacterized protein n=1 Tax=Vitis vinifera TaxID=29760 RepID=D7TQB8_VITVI